MAIDLSFRRKATPTLTNQIGCYALCDLDQAPICVGQSADGIRARVNRHLTSAVKNSKEIAGAIQAHFQRLQKYHRELLRLAVEVEGDQGDA